MQQPAFELPGLDLERSPRGFIDYTDRHARKADSIAQLGGEIPLDLLSAEILDARQDALDQHIGARLREKRCPVGDAIARVALAQLHLIGAPIAPRTGERQLLAKRPEAQQADAELALKSALALRLQMSLHRIAHVRGHVVKVGGAVVVFAHSLAIVFHPQIMLSPVLAA